MKHDKLAIYPAKHFVTPSDRLEKAIADIKLELVDRVKVLTQENKDLAAKRLESRTRYDMEMLAELGFGPVTWLRISCGQVGNGDQDWRVAPFWRLAAMSLPVK